MLNKEDHDRDGVWISQILRFYFSVFSLVFNLIEKIFQTLTTEFVHISKRFKVRQKYSAARCIFKSLLGVGNLVKLSLS